MSVNVVKTKTEVAQQRWLQIIADKLKTGESHKKVAKRFGVSTKTIERALDWGREQGLFKVNARERLLYHIIELTKQLDWINEEKDLAVDRTRDENGKRIAPLMPHQFVAISRQMRETRVKVLELEGLCKNVLNLRPVGEDDKQDDTVEVKWIVVDAARDSDTRSPGR
jgi:transposase-like protein